jgi:predicted ATPase
MLKAAARFRYNRKIFIGPQWPEIFTQHAERQQDIEQTTRTGEAITAVYRNLDTNWHTTGIDP